LDSPAFEWVCRELIERSTLDRLEARGTVRIALKRAGLEARNVTSAQMQVVLEKVLPGELEQRDVEDFERLCRALGSELSAARLGEAGVDSPDEVFRRLGGA
jgi:hypothetical protein